MIRSVDGSLITSFCVHECEGSSRMGYRPRRYLFTGHTNGTIQVQAHMLIQAVSRHDQWSKRTSFELPPGASSRIVPI